ncbi:MAG: hypothetical protein ACKVOK_16835 [Flavobacteriales bacterium]
MDRIRIILVLVVAMAFGFMLEMVKVNLNYILEFSQRIPGYNELSATERENSLEAIAIDAPYDYYHNHRKIQYLYTCSQSRLNLLKWLVTLIGTGFFLLVHLLLVKWITKEKLWVRWTLLLYTIFFVLSFLIYLFGKWTGTLEQAYGISRKIAGALQSLVPLMLIIPGWWIWKNDKNKKLQG